MYTNGHGTVPIKLYFKQTVASFVLGAQFAEVQFTYKWAGPVTGRLISAERGPDGGMHERPERTGEGPQFNRAVVSASKKCSYLCFKTINETHQCLRVKAFLS